MRIFVFYVKKLKYYCILGRGEGLVISFRMECIDTAVFICLSKDIDRRSLLDTAWEEVKCAIVV